MLIRQMHQKSVIFVIAIVSVTGSDFRILFWYTSKDDAISILKNSDLIKQSRLL